MSPPLSHRLGPSLVIPPAGTKGLQSYSCLVFLFTRFAGWSGYADGGLPVVLNGGWQFFHMRYEAGDLPHVFRAKRFFPGGHAGVTDAGADGVEDVPLRITGRIGDEIGS